MAQPSDQDKAAIACCIAHRCPDHADIPPLNMSEGNGSSECGVCAAEEMGARFGEALEREIDNAVILPLLDGYADRLSHHAVLKERLAEARTRLELLQPGAGEFLSEVLRGDV